MNVIKIGDRLVGERCKTFIVAECGISHNGEFLTAKRMIDAAKDCGADAVKFQIYQTDKFVTKDTPTLDYQKKAGFDNQFEMLKSCELSYDHFRDLKKYADAIGIMFLATPHSCNEDVDVVAELCPAIKVGSGSLANYPLLKHIASKKLPVILSTGMATVDDVIKACLHLFKNKVILLHCTSEYPCPVENANLNIIKTLKASSGMPIGFSDHTESLTVPALAVAMGASVIEKHFTLDKKMKGPDHAFSLNSEEFKQMVNNIREAETAMGSFEKKPTIEELKIRVITRNRGLKIGNIH